MPRHYALVLGPSEIVRVEKGDRSWVPGALARMAEQSVLRTSGFTTVEAESRETGFSGNLLWLDSFRLGILAKARLYGRFASRRHLPLLRSMSLRTMAALAA